MIICAQTLVHKYRTVFQKTSFFHVKLSKLFLRVKCISSRKFYYYPFMFLLMRWQASILFPSIGQPTFSDIFKTFSSKSPSLTLRGAPTNPKHSRLEYWAFAQHWRSMETSLSESIEFTCLAVVSLDCSFSKSSLNLRIWSIIWLLEASISVCWDSTIEIRFFFSSLPRVSSVYSDVIEIFISYRRLGCQNYAFKLYIYTSAHYCSNHKLKIDVFKIFSLYMFNNNVSKWLDTL